MTPEQTAECTRLAQETADAIQAAIEALHAAFDDIEEDDDE